MKHRLGALALVLSLLGLAATVASAQVDSLEGDITSMNANTAAPSAPAASQSATAIESKLDDISLGGGSWEVSASGSFRYTVPIDIPSGRGGIQPSLDLVYDSQTENGLLGAGWTLRGIPAIERIPFARGIKFDGGDQFAFNDNGWGTPVAGGSRLVMVEPYTYHTAVESFAQFRAYGDCDNGSCYWEMKDGEGRTYRFGGMSNAVLQERDAGFGVQRGVQAWALTSVEDLHGNSYQIFYQKDEWMMYPSRVVLDCAFVSPGWPTWVPQWPPKTGDPVGGDAPTIPDSPSFPGSMVIDPNAPSITVGTVLLPPPVITIDVGNPTAVVQIPKPGDDLEESCSVGGGPKREIVFSYWHGRRDRARAPAQYHRRLRSIRVLSGGTPVAHYELDYEESPAGISRLRSVGRRATGSNPSPQSLAPSPQSLAPLAIEWTDGIDESFSPMARSTWGGNGNLVSSHTGDINGDGFADLIRISFGDELVIDYRLGSAEGLAKDGQTIVRKGESFDAEDGDALTYREWRSTLADVDGDGLQDLILWFAGDRRAFLMVAAGDPSGAFRPFAHYRFAQDLMSFARNTVGPFAARSYRLVPADFNGDQISDLTLVNNKTQHIAFIAGSTSGLTKLTERRGAATGVTGWRYEPVVADFNGDGIADLLLPREAAGGSLTAAYSLGTTSGLSSQSAINWGQLGIGPPTHPSASGWITPSFQALAGDINGDRAVDLTLAYAGPVQIVNGGMFPFARDVRSLLGNSDLNNADSREQVAGSAFNPVGISFQTNQLAFWQHHSGDVNCDGLSDLVMYYGGQAGQAVRWQLADGQGGFAPVTSHSRLDSSPSTAYQADGDRYVHKWRSRLADVNGDGCDDFVRYYAGAGGVHVDVAYGSADGLADQYAVALSQNTAVAETGGSMHRAASVELHTTDVNGDGALDFVMCR